ncbi:MAG: SAM-dependent chlorinase/fluorinase [Chloroflexi bacterium]|nr:SAM-dependent chlorinase/fluorinase [Chloroflexota bacterium]
MKLITLLTDFGLRDGYSGVMKGVIYRITPDAKIADISHAIRPQDVREGSLVWFRSIPFFPPGTIHVGVVDPGVGTNRRPIAARLGEHYFVCPDNGLITPLLEQAEQAGEPVEIVHLDQPRFWLPEVSNVFHGRDIFSPVAAHLANGVALSELGTPITDPVRLPLPRPKKTPDGLIAEIISIDHFGNLSTNITGEDLKSFKNFSVRVAGREIPGLVKTFGESTNGALIALIDSDGNMAIAIVNGNAHQEIGAGVGDTVEIISKQD